MPTPPTPSTVRPSTSTSTWAWNRQFISSSNTGGGGVKYHVGLLDTKRLPGATDSYHYQDVTLVVNFHF